MEKKKRERESIPPFKKVESQNLTLKRTDKVHKIMDPLDMIVVIGDFVRTFSMAHWGPKTYLARLKSK